MSFNSWLSENAELINCIFKGGSQMRALSYKIDDNDGGCSVNVTSNENYAIERFTSK